MRVVSFGIAVGLLFGLAGGASADEFVCKPLIPGQPSIVVKCPQQNGIVRADKCECPQNFVLVDLNTAPGDINPSPPASSE